MKALGWLKSSTATAGGKLRTVLRALRAGTDDAEALQRMGFASAKQSLASRLVALALEATRSTD